MFPFRLPFRARSRRPAAPDRLQFHLRKQLNAADGPVELDIALDIARGESLALLGPSGSGKTSLLRLLAGLQAADGGYIAAFGNIWLDSAHGIDQPPRRRRAGLVFQDYALFPNMSVQGNVRFALPPGRPARQADELLERVGLGGLARQAPAQLSGGQQQRLALARALAAEPELLLLDEPLSALDGSLRRDLQDALASLREQRHTTLLLVTHDPGEALRLCQRAVLLEAGRVIADMPPHRLFGGGPLADAEQRLTLTGRVLERLDGADGSPLYRIAAEGRTCLARPEQHARLQPGDSVLVSAGDWLATPL